MSQSASAIFEALERAVDFSSETHVVLARLIVLVGQEHAATPAELFAWVDRIHAHALGIAAQLAHPGSPPRPPLDR